MQWKNTENEFGAVSKSLHWIVAFGVLVSYGTIYAAKFIFEGSKASPSLEQRQLLMIHVVFGVAIGLIVVARLAWRQWGGAPAAEGSRLTRMAARSMHWLLYAAILAMPISGYFGFGAMTYKLGPLMIPGFKSTGLWTWMSASLGVSWTDFERPFDLVHRIVGSWLLWPLIGLHIAAALYHHFYLRDGTLRRMLPRAGGR